MAALIGVVLVLSAVGGGLFLLLKGLSRSREQARRARRKVEVRPTRRIPRPEAELRPERLPPKHSSGLMRQVADADIELEIRSGRVFNAIRLYREQTGANAQDAKNAVEAWKSRLTAS